jgi:sodium-dependent dicarboxylate transporter 2/3/5
MYEKSLINFFPYTEYKDAQYEPLLDWKFVATKLPWSVLLLLGSGFAIADAFAYSGLSDSFIERIQDLENISHKLLLLYVIIVVCFITEFVSNTACASIILPILLSVVKK